MYLHLTESELKSSFNGKTTDQIVEFLMDNGLALKAEAHEYSVSLTFDVEASSPEEAVMQMIGITEESLMEWTYDVTDIDTGENFSIHAYSIEEKG